MDSACISIPGVVKKKTAKTFSSLSKPGVTIHSVKCINPRKKPAGKIWHELLEPIFITVKIIRSYSDHVVFLWVYNNHKYILAVETDDIILTTENIICFERLTQEFDTLFDYTYQ